jgi:hypothetical protein
MKRIPRSTPALIIGLALLLLLTTTGGAVAGGLITGKKIKDGTITSADVKDKSIAKKDLAASALAATGATGPAGPTGATGAAGAAGANGTRGFSAWDVIPSGVTVMGEDTWDASTTGASSSDGFIVSLPGVAPVALVEETVNFATAAGVVDADATCTGTVFAPTAPAGKVCLYVGGKGAVGGISGMINTLPTRAFYVGFTPTGNAGVDQYLSVSWAYTAP